MKTMYYSLNNERIDHNCKYKWTEQQNKYNCKIQTVSEKTIQWDFNLQEKKYRVSQKKYTQAF